MPVRGGRKEEERELRDMDNKGLIKLVLGSNRLAQGSILAPKLCLSSMDLTRTVCRHGNCSTSCCEGTAVECLTLGEDKGKA